MDDEGRFGGRRLVVIVGERSFPEVYLTQIPRSAGCPSCGMSEAGRANQGASRRPKMEWPA